MIFLNFLGNQLKSLNGRVKLERLGIGKSNKKERAKIHTTVKNSSPKNRGQPPKTVGTVWWCNLKLLKHFLFITQALYFKTDILFPVIYRERQI